MDFRRLKYFLIAAEELNFTRAAKRLHIAQPPLTQQIKKLEGELGVALFDRSGYRIQLTAAGRVLAAEGARILGDVRSAALATKRAARGSVGQVRVGFTESASFNPLVTTVFRNFRSTYPAVQVSLEEGQSTELALGLQDGRIDVAFLRPPLNDSGTLALELLEQEPMVVAIPRGHPLARRREIFLGDLEAEAFILYPRSVRPGLADIVITACQRAGFEPRVIQYAPQLSSTINFVAASLGISIVPASMRGLQPQSVSYVALRGSAVRAFLGIAHRSDEVSSGVLKFAELARSTANSLRISVSHRGSTRGV